MRRAILVMGPESSGTRLATEICIAGGCAGDDGHEQRWDDGLPAHEELIVWRRSVPHFREWPDLVAWIEDTRTAGFLVEGVVVQRDWRSMCLSQVRREHVRTDREAEGHIQMAYHAIWASLTQTVTPAVTLSYEALVQWPGPVQAWLAGRLSLPAIPRVGIVDGNVEYYRP